MKVLITSQVFPPEVHPTAVMVRELAEGMANEGWQITVATGFPHHPYGRLYPGYHLRYRQTEVMNGFRVIRGWHLISPKAGLVRRALAMGTQTLAFLWGGARDCQPEVVISYGPPLLGPLVSALIARRSEARLVTAIYDIYPDILIRTGHLRNPLITVALRLLERFVYKYSDCIVVLSDGFRRTLIKEKKVPSDKVTVIPVWLDGRDIAPMDRLTPWRREMDIGPEKFVVLYAGTAGLVSGAEVVVDAARHLHAVSDILFLFVGEGHAKNQVKSLALQAGLRNIRFLPFQPRERLSEVQATADISLVTLAPGQGKTSVPSKVLGYMAAARPVIASVDDDCDTAELVRRAKCGLVVLPADGRALADAIQTFYFQPQTRQEAGEAGHSFFLQHYEREAVTQQYLRLIQERILNCRKNL